MYSHIIFTGGGLPGISYLGSIRYLQENNFHKDVHEVSGTSIGAFVACLFAMHILPDEIEAYLKDLFKKEEIISFSMMDSMMTMMDTYGMDDGKRLIVPLKHFIEKKYGWKEESISFRDFVKKTGINVVICATNIETRLPVYFSIDTTPDVCLYDAVRASMTVPILMAPVTICGEKYVDGGLADNIPVAGFRKSGQNRILVVAAAPIISHENKPDHFFSYMSILMQIILNNSYNTDKLKHICTSYDVLMLDKSPIPFIKLDTYDDGTVKVVITEEDIENLIIYGYTSMYHFIKEKLEKIEKLEN